MMNADGDRFGSSHYTLVVEIPPTARSEKGVPRYARSLRVENFRDIVAIYCTYDMKKQ
jgi:hypothetical protein